MFKQFLSMALASAIVLSMSVSAVDMTNSQQPLFSDAQTVDSQQDRELTVTELYQVIQSDYPRIGLEATDEEELLRPATNADLLHIFTICETQCPLIKEVDGTYLYPAGSSSWMSADEWSALQNQLNQPLLLSTVQTILKRTQEVKAFLNENQTPGTPEKFDAVVNALFPQFSDLADESDEAVAYWLDGQESRYEFGRLENTLHELAHEGAARRSGVFQSRAVTSDTLEVTWSALPSIYYFYAPSDGTWRKIETKAVVSGRTAAARAPKDVQSTYLYDVYTRPHTSAMNHGIYGMLQEYCSAIINTRIRVVSSSFNYHYSKDVVDTMFKEVTWWEGLIAHYFVYLKVNFPIQYRLLTNDKDLMQLLMDNHEYVQKQKELAGTIKSTGDKDYQALAKWAAVSVP